jgi:hypothetical protein
MSTGLSQGQTETNRTTNRRGFFEMAALVLGALAVPGCDRDEIFSVSMPTVHDLDANHPLSIRSEGDLVKIALTGAEIKFSDYRVKASGMFDSEMVYIGQVTRQGKLICTFISDRAEINQGEVDQGHVFGVVTAWGRRPRLYSEKIVDFRRSSLRCAGMMEGVSLPQSER